jgi:hypothetical protein
MYTLLFGVCSFVRWVSGRLNWCVFFVLCAIFSGNVWKEAIVVEYQVLSPQLAQ